MKTIRSFLAVNLEIKTVRSLAAEQLRLKDLCNNSNVDIKWFAPQNMHITINFLGNVTEPMIQAIKDSLESLCRSFPPFELQTSRLGVFPDKQNPHVIWAGIDDETGELVRLHNEVSKILKDTGFKLDNKPFKSHVTIGRVRSSDPLPENLLESENEPFFGSTNVRDLLCYRSDLSPKGADYYMLWKLPLMGRITQNHSTQIQRDASDDDAQEQEINE